MGIPFEYIGALQQENKILKKEVADFKSVERFKQIQREHRKLVDEYCKQIKQLKLVIESLRKDVKNARKWCEEAYEDALKELNASMKELKRTLKETEKKWLAAERDPTQALSKATYLSYENSELKVRPDDEKGRNKKLPAQLNRDYMKSSDERNSHYNKYSILLYEVMTSELDANNAAIEKMSSLKEEFKDEAKYQTYLEGRQNYYANLADKIALNMNKKDAALLDTVGFAYKNNELSEEEYNDLQNIIGKEGYDMCEKRSLEIDESLSQVNLQDKADIENLSLERNSQEEIFKANDEVEAVENVETEEAGMEEKTAEELAKEDTENEENSSVMLKELENSEVEDINFGEESAMIDYLDSGDENILIENESAMIEDLGELENIDNSSSESNDYSSSGDIGMD